MPTYFDLTFQKRTKTLEADYVDRLYQTIIDAGYPFKGGYWFHKAADYEEIVDWNQQKLSAGFQLDFKEHVKHDYMQILFESEEHKLRGFWMYSPEQISFTLITPETALLNEEDCFIEMKIAPLIKLAVTICQAGLAEAAQTALEGDGGVFALEQIGEKNQLMLRPFAIVTREQKARLQPEFFGDKSVLKLQENHFLIIDDEQME